jgi:hypothetical protein
VVPYLVGISFQQEVKFWSSAVKKAHPVGYSLLTESVNPNRSIRGKVDLQARPLLELGGGFFVAVVRRSA